MKKTSTNLIKASDDNESAFSESVRKQVTGHHWFMMACCVAMAVVFAFLLWTTPANQSLTSTLLAALPLLICVGMHFVMHRFMGKSCHSTKTEKE